jgi:hypothetical protein
MDLIWIYMGFHFLMECMKIYLYFYLYQYLYLYIICSIYIYTHIIYTYIYMYTGAIKSTSVSRFIVLADRFLLWVINSSPQ